MGSRRPPRSVLAVLLPPSFSPLYTYLLPGEDKTLLVRGDALLVLNLGLDVVNRVRGLHLEGDGLPRERLHENLHGACWISATVVPSLTQEADVCVSLVLINHQRCTKWPRVARSAPGHVRLALHVIHIRFHLQRYNQIGFISLQTTPLVVHISIEVAIDVGGGCFARRPVS